MRILLIHNRYQRAGGEDVVFELERALLEAAGHRVVSYERSNDEIRALSPVKKLDLMRRTIWATDSMRDLGNLVKRERPAVCHFHNTFPLVSPAAYGVCRRMGAVVVQTVQNYRLICPNAQLRRDGHVCRDCVGRWIPWPGVLHACYRGSRAASAAVAAMLTVHRLLRTWQTSVDVYVAATEFAKAELARGGLPSKRIVVKPNFLNPDPGHARGKGDYVLFVGRLSEEKGVRTMLRAWKTLRDVPLRIAGDGPLKAESANTVARWGSAQVSLLGWRSREAVLELMKGARFLVFPSEWYEGFPTTLVQAFACGLPVVGARIGGVAEILEDGRTGSLFVPGDAQDLARKVCFLWGNPDMTGEMGRAARAEFESRYTAERNYELLMTIYRRAMAGQFG